MFVTLSMNHFIIYVGFYKVTLAVTKDYSKYNTLYYYILHYIYEYIVHNESNILSCSKKNVEEH